MRIVASVLIGALLLLVPIELNATETVSFDGVWWGGLSRSDKLTAVEGMLSGMAAGYTAAMAAMVSGGASSTLIGKVKALKPESKFTLGTIIDRIDAVYRDHPKLADIRVSQFVVCAANWDEGCEFTAKLVEP